MKRAKARPFEEARSYLKTTLRGRRTRSAPECIVNRCFMQLVIGGKMIMIAIESGSWYCDVMTPILSHLLPE